MYLGAVEVDDWYVVLIGLEPRIVARRGNIDFLIFKHGLRVAHSSWKTLKWYDTCAVQTDTKLTRTARQLRIKV